MRTPNALLADSGFWIAMFDPRDPYHEEAQTLPIDLDSVDLLVPWPSLYETLNTRFVKDRRRLAPFLVVLKKPNVRLLDDQSYRADAYDIIERFNTNRAFSLVDVVVRIMLADTNLRVRGLVTFNKADFVDVCRAQSIELFPA